MSNPMLTALFMMGVKSPYAVEDTPTSTFSSGTSRTYVSREFALTNGAMITHIGFDITVATTGAVKILKENSSTNYDVVVSKNFSHTGSGWEDFQLDNVYTVPLSGTYRVGVYYVATGSPTLPSRTGPRAFNSSGSATGTGLTFSSDTNPHPASRVRGLV